MGGKKAPDVTSTNLWTKEVWWEEEEGKKKKITFSNGVPQKMVGW